MRKKELVEELKEAYPAAYDDLYEEATKEVGNKKHGWKLAIDLAMQRMIEDFLKKKGLD